MIRPGAILTPDILRGIQTHYLERSAEEYSARGEFGAAPRRELKQRINNVKGQDLRRAIDAVKPFGRADVRAAWSHFMAVMAGRHFFPDANHRTASTAFAFVTTSGWASMYAVSSEGARAMKTESKAMRDEERLRRHPPAYYTVAELDDPTIPISGSTLRTWIACCAPTGTRRRRISCSSNSTLPPDRRGLLSARIAGTPAGLACLSSATIMAQRSPRASPYPCGWRASRARGPCPSARFGSGYATRDPHRGSAPRAERTLLRIRCGRFVATTDHTKSARGISRRQ